MSEPLSTESTYTSTKCGTLTLINSYTYSSWGAPTTTVAGGFSDLGLRFLYVGRFDVQWDNFSSLGLHYMHARHYSATIGRFMQPDPARAEASHYAYANNNAVSAIDPCGLVSFVWGACGGIGVKAIPVYFGGTGIFVQIVSIKTMWPQIIGSSWGTIRFRNLFTGAEWYRSYSGYHPTSHATDSVSTRAAPGLYTVTLVDAWWVFIMFLTVSVCGPPTPQPVDIVWVKTSDTR